MGGGRVGTRVTNHEAIRLQNRLFDLNAKINKLQDDYEQAVELLGKELRTLPAFMKRLDADGKLIPADLADGYKGGAEE